MLESKEAQAGPATASPLNAAWLRITGEDNWVSTKATVYSCEYTDLPNQSNGEVGHYHVTYSYAANGELYTGQFIDFGRQDEESFKRDDTFIVRYDPRNPAKSYYPNLRTQNRFRLICAGIGAALGLVAIILYALAQHNTR
jgi:hypothetical protein